jgi:gliding motility-associated-like protein
MKAYLMTFAMIVGIAFNAVGQNLMTTMGTDFWFTFMDNADPRQNDNMLTVYISAPRSCSATVANPNTGWSATAVVTPGVVTTLHVPQAQGYSTSTSTPLNTGLHLTATDTVSVYISTLGLSNFDECNVLPTAALRDRYMVQSYPSDWYGSEFVVLATEDSTWVDIHLTNATSDGATSGSTVSVFFPVAGKSYQLKTPSVGDFSGTRVEARDCKKIAVFHGDVCVYVPNHDAGSCDHVIEQAVPVYYWGQHFVAAGSGSPVFPDCVRITSLENNCVVRRDGNVICALASGQTYEYPLYSNALNHGYSYLTSTKPVSVNIFFASSNTGTGDPSMLNIRPLEQTIHRVTFNTSNTAYINTHYILVTLRTEDITLLRLDGTPVTQTPISIYSNPNYKFIKINVSAGSHTLSMNGGSGFLANAYGLGNHESYAYTLGSSMNDLTSTLYVNGTPVSFGQNHNFCLNDSISFSVTYNSAPDTIIWDFGDGTTQGGDSVIHQFTAAGHYHIGCQLINQTNCQYNGINSVTVNIHNADTIDIDTVGCDSLFVWDPDTIAASGTYSRQLTGVYGCDSLVALNLRLASATYANTTDTVCGDADRDTLLIIAHGTNHLGCDSIERQSLHIVAPQHSTLDIEGCDSILLDGTWHHTSFTADLTYQDRYGCDSTVSVSLLIHPSYNSAMNITIPEGDTIIWIDGNQYSDTTDHASVTYYTTYGCDSIIRLQLHYTPYTPPVPIDSSAVWVPNAFTPEGINNTHFKVFSHDVIAMQVHIFTREGVKVCQFDGLTEEWDGTAGGQTLKQDAYVYFIEYIVKSKPTYTQHKIGTVLLWR